MKNKKKQKGRFKTEYKILTIVLIFSFLLIGSSYFFIRYFQKNDPNEVSVSCKDVSMTNPVPYISKECTFEDELFQYQIRYPQFISEKDELLNLNTRVQEEYDQLINDLSLSKDTDRLDQTTVLDYEIDYYDHILSIVIQFKDVSSYEDDMPSGYLIYAYSELEDKMLSRDELADHLGIRYDDISYQFKSAIISLYSDRYTYSYYGALSDQRNEQIDQIINHFRPNNLTSFFVDHDGSFCTILALEDLASVHSMYYRLCYEENGKVSFVEEH